MKTVIFTIIKLCMSLSLIAWTQTTMAQNCTFASGTANLGTMSAFAVKNTVQSVTGTTGFKCTGSALSLLSTNFVTAVLASSANNEGGVPQLKNTDNAATIPYGLCQPSSCSTPLTIGQEILWTSTSLLGLLGLFNASDGSLPVTISTKKKNVPAGTYKDTLTLQWNYYICFIGVAGLCVYTTGSGTTTIEITLIAQNQCYINDAADIAFGEAAFPSRFTEINSTIGVECTLDASYQVNLASAQPMSGSWRQMASVTSGTTNYLQYQLRHNNSTIWGPTNNYAGIGTGEAQVLPVNAAVNTLQSNIPAGTYTDVVTVTLSY
jgi:spore coat protein U-like protein